MRVKGALVLDLVKLIRSDRNRDWGKYLNPEDLEIVNSIILASNWYPGESYWRISYAVAKELGGLNLDVIFAFGRENAKTVIAVYGKLFVVPGDPVASIKNSIKFRETLYDFEDANYVSSKVESGDDWIKCNIHVFPDMPIKEMEEPFFYGLGGYCQEIVEHTTGKKAQTTIKNRAEYFEIYLKWEV